MACAIVYQWIITCQMSTVHDRNLVEEPGRGGNRKWQAQCFSLSKVGSDQEFTV